MEIFDGIKDCVPSPLSLLLQVDNMNVCTLSRGGTIRYPVESVFKSREGQRIVICFLATCNRRNQW